jgi:hypothetical protein
VGTVAMIAIPVAINLGSVAMIADELASVAISVGDVSPNPRKFRRGWSGNFPYKSVFRESLRSQPTPKQDFDAAGRCSPSIVFGKVDPWHLCDRSGQLGSHRNISLILLCF